MNLLFNAENQVWSAEYNNQVTDLVKLNGDNTAQLYVDGDIVNVTLDAQGVGYAQMLLNNSFAMK